MTVCRLVDLLLSLSLRPRATVPGRQRQRRATAVGPLNIGDRLPASNPSSRLADRDPEPKFASPVLKRQSGHQHLAVRRRCPLRCQVKSVVAYHSRAYSAQSVGKLQMRVARLDDIAHTYSGHRFHQHQAVGCWTYDREFRDDQVDLSR